MQHAAESLTAAIARRDLHAVAWALLADQVAASSPNPGLLSTLIRVLASLGPVPLDESEALVEAEFRGFLMSGLAPRSPEEWRRAEVLFDDSVLQELRSRPGRSSHPGQSQT